MKNLEIWKPITEWEGLYSISNLGRVRREPTEAKIMSPFLSRGGYRIVLLSRYARKHKYSVHRLVASHFLKSIPKPTVHHIDGNKTNNIAPNLKYVTPHENSADAALKGLYSKGKDHHSVKLTEQQVLDIRRRYSTGKTSHNILAREYRVHPSSIGYICQRRTWKHI